MDFNYGNTTINASGPIKPSGKNMPGDPRIRVETYADIASIPTPYAGMLITVLADETNNSKMTDYKVKSLKANSFGVANSLIDEVVRYVDYLGVASGGGSSSGGSSVEVVNDLTTGGIDKALSAEQGKVIKSSLETNTQQLQEHLTNHPSGGFEKNLKDLKNETITNASEYLEIPTYDGLNQIVHSKVLYFKNGWNGYKFWMGHTPLPYIPSVDESKENPCIMVSNDGETWITPNGLTNPLDTPQLVSCQYLSDTHLVMVNNTLEIWYRSFNPEVIYKKTSTDGINWSNRIEIMRGNGENIVCPTVIFDENKYKLWVCKKITTPSIKYILDYMESSDGINFTHIRDIELSNTNIGHHDIIKTNYGYECVFHERGDKKIWYTRSSDNVTYDTCLLKMEVVPDTWNNNKLYRPNLTVVDGDYYLYYTGGLSTQGAKIGLVKIVGDGGIKATDIIEDDDHIFVSKKQYNSIISRLEAIEGKLDIIPPPSFEYGDIFTFKKGVKLNTTRWDDINSNGAYVQLHNVENIENGVLLNGATSFGEVKGSVVNNNVSYTVSIKYKYETPPTTGKVLFFSNVLTSASPRCIRIQGSGLLAYDGNLEVVNKTINNVETNKYYVVDFVYEHGQTSNTSKYTVYVNGVSVGNGNCTSQDNPFNFMLIGKQLDTEGQFGNITVEYITAYSRALNSSEINKKYTDGI